MAPKSSGADSRDQQGGVDSERVSEALEDVEIHLGGLLILNRADRRAPNAIALRKFDPRLGERQTSA